MPEPIYGNIDRDPVGVFTRLLALLDRPGDAFAAFVATLDAAGAVFDQTGRAGPVITITDSGTENGGDGGGTQPLVTCLRRHGLQPGDSVTLTGTDGYDGTYIIEPAGDDSQFLLDNVAFVAVASGGSWN